ncbi:hypothetical protein WA026_006634 [Henosepilachna vigintioctopunctata]|uniref:Cytochrome b5 heme-binding domain-containing protein n=1 Tax=Henosepilachna vigintioctopunctata TaxID=420089 RepID=A0AAW1U7D8_9CUCU
MAEATVLPIVGPALAKYTRAVNLSKFGGNELTLQEVLCHDSRKDCWVVIYDRVYDVTDFLDKHPGGADLLLEYAGRDASVAFRSSGHSNTALSLLEKFFIGELPPHERIFRKTGGFKLSDIPE